MDDFQYIWRATQGRRRIVSTGLLILLMLGLSVEAMAQQGSVMSTADRLKLLYSSQLNFTPKGDPIIRLGLLQNETTISFTPSEAIRVLPSGEGGPEIQLPGNKTYTVTISNNQPGKYKHWVVVARLPVAQRSKQDQVKESWLQRGYVPSIFEVGGLFAVQGKVFDSRTSLFVVGGMSDIKKARAMQRKLQAKFGIEGGIHSQLVKHPQGQLTLRGEGLPITIQHRDILQIAPKAGRSGEIRYRVPNIRKNYSKGRETRIYTGRLIFAPDRRGKLVLINSLGAERILKGVVPAEIFANAPDAALRAQAIAARNEIFSAVGVRNLADPYMLRADVYDQVYKGVGAERPKTSQAVDATRGQVMFFGKEIVEAFYSSNAGGFTENNENVWAMEPRPYLRGKPDAPLKTVPKAFKDGISTKELGAFLKASFPAYSKSAPASSSRLYRWTRTVPASKPLGWLKDAGYKIGQIKDVKILSRGVSGRIIRLKVFGTKSSAIVERELNVRRLFGGLRSGLFVMKAQKRNGIITSFSFEGAGFGHGVGMCQTGAIGMAAKGFAHKAILNHYYKGISIKKMY